MRTDDVTAAGELLSETLADGTTFVREIHAGIAARAFAQTGAMAAPARVIHDGVSAAIYGLARTATRALPRAGALALRHLADSDGPPASASPRGSVLIGALNGVIGDRLARQGNALALTMTVRQRGADVPLTEDGVDAAFRLATGKVVVFLHGLCETDEAWRLRAPGEQVSVTYGERLCDDLGYTPVYIRYNTGKHVSDNGRELALLLDRLLAVWPVPVETLALVGHSMGGLVARSACHYAAADDLAWTEPLCHVFCLGTPHLGAPMERAAHVAAWGLWRLPETRPIAKVINRRSSGIRDMAFGAVVEEDWSGSDPEAFLADRCGEVPFLPTAAYFFIGATLTRTHDRGISRVVGDLLVQFPSASGAGPRRSLPFEVDNGAHVGGLHHFNLLNHPAVYARLHEWLKRPPCSPPAPIARQRAATRRSSSSRPGE